MNVVWNHCKTKMVCETDEPKEEGEGAEENGNYKEVKKGHGGCGHIQPLIRKEALKLFVQYKKSRDDDDVRNLLFAFLFSYLMCH
jgi:DNA-directed RNA polymerase II subunit RPB1